MAFNAFLTSFTRGSEAAGALHHRTNRVPKSQTKVSLHPGEKLVRGWAIALTGLVGGVIGLTIHLQPVNAQPTAANDGTQTNVRQNGQNQFDIDGGQLSRDGANLFHSFQDFGLDANQIANFLSNSEIRNIISRVVGGNPSLIDGLIRVSGGDSNLFLLNPSGIVFGQNARLDVPGSFSASTATGIGIGDRWFNVSGENDYASLVGTPSQFAFRTSTPGSVINAGDLRVAEGESITLLGGTVINTGTVEGSEILITAVPGESLVRLSQEGHVLSLEVTAIAPDSPEASQLVEWSAPVASIPELLTGGNVGHATGLQVNEDGTVSLNGSQVSVNPGSVTVSGQIDATHDAGMGGQVAIAGSDIQVIDATIDASGRTGGGDILIGGDERGAGTFPTGDRTTVDANSVIAANAIETGDGGRIIVWADGTTNFAGSVNARGGETSGNGGFIEVSGKETLVFLGTADLDAPNGQLGTILLDPENIRIVNGGAAEPTTDDLTIAANANPAEVTISEAVLENIIGNVILEATNNITIETLGNGDDDVGLVFLGVDPQTGLPIGGTITFRADADLDGSGDFSMDTGDRIVTSGRDLTIQGANITTGDIDTRNRVESNFEFGPIAISRSGDLIIEATGNITVGHVSTQNNGFSELDADREAGNVTISSQRQLNTTNRLPSPGGSVQVRSIDASSLNGQGGNVEVVGDLIQITDAIDSSPLNQFSFLPDSINVSGASFESTEPTVDNSGTIVIRHAGGPDNIPFVIGARESVEDPVAAVSDNGSAAPLSRVGAFSFDPENSNSLTGSFPVSINGGVDGSASENGIRVISVNRAPSLVEEDSLFGIGRRDSLTLTGADIFRRVSDPDNDTVVVILDGDSITPGATLTLNGIEITSDTPLGDRIVSEDSEIIYTPPRVAGRDAERLDAFTLTASDVQDGQPPFATSEPIQVQVEVGAVSPSPNPRPRPRPVPTPDPDPDLPVDSGTGIDIPDELDPDINGDPVNEVEEPETSNFYIGNANRSNVLDTYISSLEFEFVQTFTDYLGLPVQPELTTADEAQDIARLIEEATGEKPAFVYVNFVPEALDLLPGNRGEPRSSDQLELVVITAEGNMFRQRVPEATRDKVLAMADQFRQDLTSPFRRDRHQSSAQQLYEWIIAPIQDELLAREITNLSFLAEAGLRSLPYAALYDGEQYLVEQYSVGLMPSLSLTDTLYVDIRNAEMLAMGVSESTQGQAPLPSVPVELSTLVFDVWRGSLHLNENVTLDNLKEFRERTPFGIIHMATHADFKAGPIEESYIQLWEDRLQMDEVRQLGWNDPPVEMLVLSACRTALGNEQAELGFAGLAVQTGVKSAIASLWYVSDTATTALMTTFYDVLNEAPIKADALRQAQIAMLRGDIRVEDGLLYVPGLTDEGIQLPEGSLTNVDLSNPYYWSGFTIVGNPW
jgi:filamentous hemagglutinin family protein